MEYVIVPAPLREETRLFDTTWEDLSLLDAPDQLSFHSVHMAVQHFDDEFRTLIDFVEQHKSLDKKFVAELQGLGSDALGLIKELEERMIKNCEESMIELANKGARDGK